VLGQLARLTVLAGQPVPACDLRFADAVGVSDSIAVAQPVAVTDAERHPKHHADTKPVEVRSCPLALTIALAF
jgi:hypothetical protein